MKVQMGFKLQKLSTVAALLVHAIGGSVAFVGRDLKKNTTKEKLQ
jgi:hypothetical protein